VGWFGREAGGGGDGCDLGGSRWGIDDG
jgi:hypothetical protein